MGPSTGKQVMVIIIRAESGEKMPRIGSGCWWK